MRWQDNVKFEDFREVKRAEGFKDEDIKKMYYGDPELDTKIQQAITSKAPTKGEQVEAIGNAILNNKNKDELYVPDFSLSKPYLELSEKINNTSSNIDNFEKAKLGKELLSINMNGTISKKERQDILDKATEMLIADVLAEKDKYEKKVADFTDKLDNFEITGIQAKIDEVMEKYQQQADKNRGRYSVLAKLQDDRDNEVDGLEKELFIIPFNDLKIQRWEAQIYFNAYDIVAMKYANEHKDIIKQGIEEARRREVIGSLAGLAPYLEEV